MTDTAVRPFSSSSSVISPYAALEALAGGESASSYVPTRTSSQRPSGSGPTTGAGPLTPLDDDGDMPFLVRARFGFQATDHSALSFSAGDLIQVFAKLDSGWWDGMLDGKRGWFPSNYVEDLGEDEMVRLEDEDMHAREIYGQHPQGYSLEPDEVEEDVLRMDDVLRGGWGDWGGDAGLDQLARELMSGEEEGENADNTAFAEEARKRRAQAEELMGGPDEFGISNRRREETDATIRPSGASTTSSATTTTQRLQRPKQRELLQGQPQDAWIPSITPDGQVYYHNTQTGEDSWELPSESLTPEVESTFSQTDDNFFNSLTSSFTPASRPGPAVVTANTENDDFRPPPKAQVEIPYPWVAKLSDDGREWFYYNRLTGQSRTDPPVTKGDATSMTEVGMGMRRLSIASGSRPLRASVELQRKAVDEWERKIAEALRAVVQPPAVPVMGTLMDNVNDALREIFEAAVAGSAAEEEMSRAEDLGSESGMIAAVMREENAVDMLATAHYNTLSMIRQVLRSFGYVGPLDRMEEMTRPPWVGDMTLIGSIGLLSANTHAAITSKRLPETGISIWAEVLRSASKVKDVIANFPNAALAGQSLPGGVDSAEGRQLEAWLGFDVFGEPLSGKWGFSKTDGDLRVLDQAVVVDVQKIRTDFDATMRDVSEGSITDLIRFATKFCDLVNQIDIASVIDVDGDNGDLGHGLRAREDDLREYDHLVEQARQSIFDLDNSTRLIQTASINLLSKIDTPDTRSAAESLAGAISTAFRALPTLLIIAGEQAAAVEQGLIRGQIGIRSPKHLASRSGSTRPTSMVSSTSRASRRSGATSDVHVKRGRVRGLEEEFLDANDYGESRDQAGQMPMTSASDSTTSLAHQHSRTSSTTSLAYQPTESDSGSQKGNRSSILRAFRRNRSDSDADARGSTRGKTPSKKLAKLLGEDVNSIPINATVPPPAAPETPWYLLDDFAPGEIIFDDKGGVKAGTLKALVVRLTQHSSTDTPFFQAFLLTFRSFTNAHELFGHLVERYNLSQPEGLTFEQAQEWKIRKQAPIRLRVANALRTWLERHYIEHTDHVVLDRIEEFANTTLLANGSELMSKQLLTLVGKRRQGEPEQTRGSASGSLLSPPAPLLPRVMGRQLRLTDVAPLEIARQLTIVEFIHFQRIKPSECLNRAWADENSGSTNAPNVRNVILTANRMAGWVALHILSSKDVRQRATAMKILIQVAVECRNLNNFSSMAGIVAGLNSAPITRLRRTKELLSAKTQTMKADLDRTLDSTKNFANYRDMLKTINPPCVPFFGFYLSALTFIEDGNRNFIQPGGPGSAGGGARGLSTSNSSSSLSTGLSGRPIHPASSSSLSNSMTLIGPGSASGTSTGGVAGAGATPANAQQLINFFKRGLNAEILRDIAQYQSQPYNLARCKPVLEWIMRGLDEVEKGGDLYEISLALEPREKEEERITRMLHDSGFI